MGRNTPILSVRKLVVGTWVATKRGTFSLGWARSLWQQVPYKEIIGHCFPVSLLYNIG